MFKRLSRPRAAPVEAWTSMVDASETLRVQSSTNAKIT